MVERGVFTIVRGVSKAAYADAAYRGDRSMTFAFRIDDLKIAKYNFYLIIFLFLIIDCCDSHSGSALRLII